MEGSRPAALAICRLCLCQTPVHFSLLRPETGEMLKAVSSIEVSDNDELPTACCTKCLLNVKLAYRIQRGILRSDQRLREAAEVKQEEMFLCGEANNSTSSSSSGESKSFAEEVCKVELFESRCLSCSKDFDGFSSYESHLSECTKKPNIVSDPAQTAEPDEESQNSDENSHHDDNDRDASENLSESSVHEKTKKKTKRKKGKRPRSTNVVPTPEGMFRCEVCSSEFVSKDQCYNHYYNTHKKPLRPCPVCSKFVSYNNLTRHMLVHAADAEKMCDVCGKTFKSKDGLRTHTFYYHHSDRYRYKCEQCGKEYLKKSDLKNHIYKQHNEGGPQFVCDTCGLKFFDTRLLRSHIRRMHVSKDPIRCSYCNREFSTPNSLKTHLRQHTNETPYRCKECGEGFKQNVSLKAHLKSKHSIEEKKEIPCKFCGKAFASILAVSAHMKIHSL